MPTGLPRYLRPSRARGHSSTGTRDQDSRNDVGRILEVPEVIKCTSGNPATERRRTQDPAGWETPQTHGQVTTRARQAKSVARPGDPPHSEHAETPCLTATTRYLRAGEFDG